MRSVLVARLEEGLSAGDIINSLGGLLPATVTAAIILFIVRETIEWIRRGRSNKRKIDAMRKLLARECELNLWAMKSLKDAIEQGHIAMTSDPQGSIAILTMANGNEHWERRDADGRMRRGGSLPPIRRTTMESLALNLAELDPNLFSALEEGLEAAAELDHLRGSLINHTDEANPLAPAFFGSFLEWALGQFDDAYAGLNQLYLACTGSKLEKSRLR